LSLSKSIENKLKEEKICEIRNTFLFLDINGKDVLETHDKNEQSLFYYDKDIEEDKELLDLFKINKDVDSRNCKYYHFRLIIYMIYIV